MDLKGFKNPNDNISFGILHKINDDEKDDHGKIPIEIENKLPSDLNKQYSPTIEPQTSSDSPTIEPQTSSDSTNQPLLISNLENINDKKGEKKQVGQSNNALPVTKSTTADSTAMKNIIRNDAGTRIIDAARKSKNNDHASNTNIVENINNVTNGKKNMMLTRQDNNDNNNNNDDRKTDSRSSQILNECNKTSAEYIKELSKIEDWCEKKVREIRQTKDDLEENKMELAFLVSSCFETFDPNLYFEIEKIHSKLNSLTKPIENQNN
jgi:hypothetical protein